MMLSFCLALVVNAAPPPRLVQLLSTIDTPTTRAALEEAGGVETAATLHALATDPTERTTLRRAAIVALAHFPTKATREVLSALVRDDDAMLRKVALDALGFAFVKDEAVEALLATALRDESPVIRRSAIRGLARRPARSAALLLEKHLSLEREVETRALLEQAVAARR
ncbi:MAG: HEAT repeat domain-containing protein [Myxococcales bacterium]|nr:HEAT repeat domain-containing protein [Myxococcales bacterium]